MAKSKGDKNKNTVNQQKQEEARARIKQAVVNLKEQGEWPEGITSRFHQLCKEKFSGETLYKHRDLWHPDSLAAEHQVEDVRS